MIAAMRRLTLASPTLMRVAWAEIVAYRAEMVIWILTATLPLVMLALWNAAAADGPIGAYGQVEFAIAIEVAGRDTCIFTSSSGPAACRAGC